MPAFPFSPGSQLATNLGMNWNQLAHFLIFLLKKSILSLSLELFCLLQFAFLCSDPSHWR